MASSNLSLYFCPASSAVTRSCPVITRLLPGRCRVCVKGRAAAPRGFQATWYALETARPSSRRLTNLKWYSLPEGLFGGHGDAAFKKIPGICSAPIDGNYRLEANLVIALPTQITPGLIVPVVTKLSPRLFSQQDLDQRAADASNKQGLVRAARKPISTA